MKNFLLAVLILIFAALPASCGQGKTTETGSDTETGSSQTDDEKDVMREAIDGATPENYTLVAYRFFGIDLACDRIAEITCVEGYGSGKLLFIGGTLRGGITLTAAAEFCFDCALLAGDGEIYTVNIDAVTFEITRDNSYSDFSVFARAENIGDENGYAFNMNYNSGGNRILFDVYIFPDVLSLELTVKSGAL